MQTRMCSTRRVSQFFCVIDGRVSSFTMTGDIMGLLAGTSTEREYVSQKLECALFGPYVEELNAFLAVGDLDLPVVVIRLAKVKVFKGKIVIQNVMHALKIMFNPGIAEVFAFRIAEDTALGLQPMAVIPDVQRISMEDNFMKLHPKKSIDQLNEIKEGLLKSLWRMLIGSTLHANSTTL